MNTTHNIPGLILKSHYFDLPLDYAHPAQTIRVFAREIISPENEHKGFPFLVYFQGGPGYQSPRPTANSGWLKRALQEYRVLLLDQRGTGLSSPITAQGLATFGSPALQAAYLKHFRADNIVRDAEAIRRALIGTHTWSILGQSYGGFCAFTYLSLAPAGLTEVFITGGVPGVTRPTDDIYRATYPRVLGKNREYYARYSDDAAKIREIADYLIANDVQMPSGGRLSVERFQQLGLGFGMSDGYEAVHYLVEEAFIDGDGDGGRRALNWNFLVQLEQQQHIDTNPIFAILHEAAYARGSATNWSAERIRAEYPQFDARNGAQMLFTGEMIYPSMFDDYPQLKPLKAAAELLAQDADWSALYDLAVLANNTVPVAAVVYYNDMYVPREFSEETASVVPNVKLWITNEYEHNGLRADGETILSRLIDMVRGDV